MLEDEDYVYFFLREQAVEYINCGKVVIMMMVMRKSMVMRKRMRMLTIMMVMTMMTMMTMRMVMMSVILPG